MKLLLTLLLISSTAFAQSTESIDTDGDGLLDREEDVNANLIFDDGETNLFDADTDDGGEADGAEIRAGRDPLNRIDDITFDLDGDGLNNGQEYKLGTDPAKADSDGDGSDDKTDPFALDSRYSQDLDGDGLPDEYEALHGLDNTNPNDATRDTDNDGLNTVEEFIYETDMLDADTDNDGINDGTEVENGTDPQENPCLMYGGVGTPFADIEDHWGKDFITHIDQIRAKPTGAHLIEGETQIDREVFIPDENITRYELLRMILLGSCVPLINDTESIGIEFRDFSPRSRPRESTDRSIKRQIIYTATSLGIIQGYKDGTIQPDATINRAEAMKILILASQLQPLDDPYASSTFSDVPKDAWFEPFIRQMVEYAIIDGYGDGTIRPGNNITRAEASKIVLLIIISNPHVNGYVIPAEEL
ncbi:MAG: S-layer homology domain-containing protein [bacterium]|nr:S-layer homology domain-containing protein [bacterium]